MFLISKIPSSERAAFEARVKRMASNLGLPHPDAADHLMAIMDLESGLSPSIVNKIGCVGLIQFCPDTPGGSVKTIGGQKVALSSLAAMTAIDQLEYVEGYLQDAIRMAGRVPRNFVDLYLLVFLPGAIGFGYSDPIKIGTAAYMDSVKRNNPAFVDASGNISKASIESVYRKRYAGLFEAAKEYVVDAGRTTVALVQKNKTPALVAGIAILLGGFLLLYYKYKQQKWQPA